MARTIFHEYIHADIIRKIQTGDVSNPSDFKSVYEKYKLERKEQYQHEMMGKLYVETMRDALKKFHKEIIPREYAYFKESYFDVSVNEDVFYEVLAWQGIKEHNVDAYLEKVKNDSIFPKTVKNIEQIQKSLTRKISL
ncbi:conserved hypothetical protein [Capnocytophaga canimorsus]|nr:hypothetical protein [Capnocytophaga canimorsus]CEN44330.1 conserved hypothetical protein [Capnocytophaga canimorsus]